MIRPFPKPWPFNSIPEPTPADWGVGVTVCVASFAKDEAIVGITDSMLSTVDMSSDNVAIKFFAIGEKWCAMYAGNDISPVPPIKRFVRSKLSPADAPETLPDVVCAFQDAFRQQLKERAESQVLGSFGLTVSELLSRGLNQFGPEIFSRLVYEIENVKLDLSFLVCGFDDCGPHMFVIQGKGEVSYYDIPGFWAVGSGQTSALGTLFSRNASASMIFMGVPYILYTLCKAKFNAETALGVGKEATAFVLASDGSRYLIHSEAIERIKRIWEKVRPPEIPNEAKQALPAIIKEARRQSKNRFRRIARMKRAKEATQPPAEQVKADAKSAGEGQ